MRPLPNVLWNIFLACLPVVIAWYIGARAREARDAGTPARSWSIPLLLVWLALLPNTCYLLTEWRHFLEAITSHPSIVTTARSSPRAMLDFLLLTAFYAAYSGVGLITFFLAIQPIDRMLRPPRYVKPAFFTLCSLGVYLGLVPRFNSWDFVHHPFRIVHTIAGIAFRPPLALLVLGFGLTLWALYFLFSLMIDGLELRLQRMEADS